MVVMVVVVAGFAVEVGNRTKAKEDKPAKVQGVKVVNSLTYQQEYDIGQ